MEQRNVQSRDQDIRPVRRHPSHGRGCCYQVCTPPMHTLYALCTPSVCLMHTFYAPYTPAMPCAHLLCPMHTPSLCPVRTPSLCPMHTPSLCPMPHTHPRYPMHTLYALCTPHTYYPPCTPLCTPAMHTLFAQPSVPYAHPLYAHPLCPMHTRYAL